MASPGKDTDLLLSSLEEIKKGSEDEAPQRGPVKGAPAESKAQPAMSLGLLDSLIDEVRKDADKEVAQIAKNQEDKNRAEREAAEAEERRKKEQYDRLIREEAQKRIKQIRRKEDEKKRQEEAEAERKRLLEAARVEAAKSKKQRKVLLVGSSVVGTAVAALVVLVATGVIPLASQQPGAVPEATEPKTEQVVADTTQPTNEQSESGIPIDEGSPSTVQPTGLVDGPAARILELPERTDIEKLALSAFPEKPEAVSVEEEEVRIRLARAFKAEAGGGHRGGKGGKGGQGGITVDTSVFKD